MSTLSIRTTISEPASLFSICVLLPRIAHLPIDVPIVYFAMGSSGSEKIVEQINHAFAGQPYRVIAPVAPLMKRLKLDPPNNVIVSDWLPPDKVDPLADVTVIHGRIGAVMTAYL